MKLTRVILLALAFAIPFASTTLASAAEEKAATDTDKPASKRAGRPDFPAAPTLLKEPSGWLFRGLFAIGPRLDGRRRRISPLRGRLRIGWRCDDSS
jgi:hypothetical protein